LERARLETVAKVNAGMKTWQPVWNDLLYKEGKTSNGSLFEKTNLVKAKNIVTSKWVI